MNFESYRDWDELPGAADTLFEQVEKQSLFFSRPWFESLNAMALEGNQSLLLVCVVDGADLLALLPLISHDPAQVDGGQGEGRWQAFRHRYTALYSLLLAEENRSDVLSCLVAGLRQLSFRSLRLEPVADDDGNLFALQRAMEAAGFECQRYFRFYNWFHRTHGQTFEDYIAARPARLRNTIARKRRKLEREHGCEMCMYRGQAVAQALTDYHTAYSASWKALEQYGALLDGLAINLSAPDWTRLAVLYIGGKAAAAQLWFVVHGKASIFRLAYDEAWKSYSPGSILTSFIMQHVIDIDRVEEIDFLAGNEAYKQDWMSERRERWGLVLFRKSEVQSGACPLLARWKRMMLRRWSDRYRD
jgi:hypothetical protein